MASARALGADKHVRGNAAGQIRRDAPRTVLTCHPHTVVGHRKRNLASRLYPAPLEFKHQADITLDLFADALDDNGCRASRKRR